MAAPFYLPRMPLKDYAAMLPQTKYEKLERLALEGKLTGAYKQGREWWIDLTAEIPQVIELTHEQEGLRNGGGDRRQVLRPLDSERKTRVRRSAGGLGDGR